MTEPKDEALREFESAANKTCIARQHAMEAAQRTCLKLRIEIERLTKERDRLDNITNIQQKQIERMMDARDAEKVRADKAEALTTHLITSTEEGTLPYWQAKHDELLGKWFKSEMSRAEMLQGLDKTIYVLKSVLIYDKLAGIDSVKDEIARLEQLK